MLRVLAAPADGEERARARDAAGFAGCGGGGKVVGENRTTILSRLRDRGSPLLPPPPSEKNGRRTAPDALNAFSRWNPRPLANGYSHRKECHLNGNSSLEVLHRFLVRQRRAQKETFLLDPPLLLLLLPPLLLPVINCF